MFIRKAAALARASPFCSVAAKEQPRGERNLWKFLSFPFFFFPSSNAPQPVNCRKVARKSLEICHLEIFLSGSNHEEADCALLRGGFQALDRKHS
jgi:hypothetical protein